MAITLLSCSKGDDTTAMIGMCKCITIKIIDEETNEIREADFLMDKNKCKDFEGEVYANNKLYSYTKCAAY